MEIIQIKETLLIPKDYIFKKRYNLWIGLSFGNKWFTKNNLEKLIDFGLIHTKKSLLILIPGRLQVSNLRYIDNLSRAQSLKKAFEMEDEKRQEVEVIVSRLPAKDQKKVVIANYDDALTPKFVKQREVLMREFSEQKAFYNSVMEISNEMLKIRGRTISKDRAESVALYVLQELPLFLNGVSIINRGELYSVILYPGLGKFDELVVKIIKSNEYNGLRNKLRIINKTGIADIE
ncbi:MAG: tRNA-dependent cyclodipeptide synthase [Patescibacteria group bacterium]